MSKHLRQGSNVSTTGASRFVAKEAGVKNGQTRTALGEVTLAAVNRKVCPLLHANSVGGLVADTPI